MKLLAGLLLATTLAATAYADPAAVAKAKTHYLHGTQLQKDGQYDAAIAEYLAAYELAPLPAMLFNLGQAYRLKGDQRQALTYYKRYLEASPTGPGTDEARDHVATLQQEVDRQDAAEADAKKRADAARANAQAEKEAADRARREQELEQEREAREAGRGLRIAGLVTGGVGVAAIAAGVVFGLHAKSLSDDVSSARGSWTDALDAEARSDGPAAQRNMIIFVSVGGVAVATGAVLYYVGWRQGLTPSITSTRTETTVSLTGRF